MIVLCTKEKNMEKEQRMWGCHFGQKVTFERTPQKGDSKPGIKPVQLHLMFQYNWLVIATSNSSLYCHIMPCISLPTKHLTQWLCSKQVASNGQSTLFNSLTNQNRIKNANTYYGNQSPYRKMIIIEPNIRKLVLLRCFSKFCVTYVHIFQ